MFNNNEVNSSEITFKPGNELEIYFPEEKTEYRLSVASQVFEGFENDLVVTLPKSYSYTFYKGEDFIQCKYVSNNIVYKFGGEILKIVHGDNCYVIIRKPKNIQKGSHRTKDRISTQILCEYFVHKIIPGEYISRTQGFATIKDASIGGVSFLTTDILPSNTVLKMILSRENISIFVEVITSQKVNDKIFYGGKIVGFEDGDDDRYCKYLDFLSSDDDSKTFVGTIY